MTISVLEDPLHHDQAPRLNNLQEPALRTALLAVSALGPCIALGVALREGITPLFWVCAGLTGLVWCAFALFRWGHQRVAAYLLVTSILLGSLGAVAAHGTVRSAAVLVLLAGLVGAGAFLPRTPMLLASLLSLLGLGGLNWMEVRGLLREPNLTVDWALWVTQGGVLMSVLLSVFHGRQRTRQAFVHYERALARANQIEAELRSSQGRFKALFQSNPVATVVEDLATNRIQEVNHAFLHLFGYGNEQLRQQPPDQLWAHPGEQARFRQRFLDQGRVRGMRATARRADGSPVPVALFAEVISDGDQQLLMLMALDMSAEESSRQALHSSEERFFKAFHFSPVGMTISRMSDGRFLEANQSNQRVLGYSQSELVNRTAEEVGLWASDEDRRAYQDALHRQPRLQGIETRLRRPSGELVPVRIWSETIDIGGEACSLAFMLDVSREREREATLLGVAKGVSGETGEPFFRSLVDQLARAMGADGAVVGDVAGSDSLHTLAIVWHGQQLPNLMHPLGNSACGLTLRQTGLFACTDQRPEPHPMIEPFARRGARAFAGMPLLDADGSAIGLLAAFWSTPQEPDSNARALMTIFASRCSAELVRLRRDREISKLQDTLEQRVQQRTAQLEYLNRELDSFAYSVSHDLKAPLRAIDGFAHLLREQTEGRLDREDIDLLNRIDNAVQRMSTLITDLLVLARMSQGQIERIDTDLTDLAESVVRQERHRDPARQVQVHIEPGLSAHCDARLAQIVLENLLGNAWKYTRKQPAARIELGASPHGTAQAPEFVIRDNGAGFDMGRADRLFKPFIRLHSATEFEGNGIGLATVRRILERHSGHIRAEGRVGEGATFWFSFGCAPAGD